MLSLPPLGAEQRGRVAALERALSSGGVFGATHFGVRWLAGWAYSLNSVCVSLIYVPSMFVYIHLVAGPCDTDIGRSRGELGF